MSQNQAAWLLGSRKPLQVRSAPYPSPQDNEIVVENKAVAINPFDWIIRDQGNLAAPWLKYPFVLGTDTSGDIVKVGHRVTRFKVGDRVVGHAVGSDEKRNSSAEGAFQKYTVLLEDMTAPIPSTLPYESACVIPLGFSTAACGLFQDDQLALQLPSTIPNPTRKTVLIWGASTSVGCNAVQLAVAAGYDVFATCSPRNFEYIRKLGASKVFDYNSKTAVSDLIEAFKGRKTAGALSIGYGAADACLDILDKCEGDKVLSMATYPVPPTPPKRFVTPTIACYYISGRVSLALKSRVRGIRLGYIYGTTLVHNGVGKAMYEGFLPEALERGAFMPAPEAEVFGTGLESLQGAVDHLKEGVSAKKIVVTL